MSINQIDEILWPHGVHIPAQEGSSMGGVGTENKYT